MSVRLVAALQGSLTRIVAQEVKAAEHAVTLGVHAATDGLKQELRDQVTGAGLGQRLAKTWRGKVFPKGESMNAAGFVFSKAPEIIDSYAHGAVIRAHKSAYLAVPLPAAGKLAGRRKLTPETWEQVHGQKLVFVPRRKGLALLVAENMRARKGKRGGFTGASATTIRTGRGLTTVPIFVLIPQITIKKRFDMESVSKKWIDRLPSMVIENWQEGDKQ
jgi:hypothetical protein